MLSLKWNSRNIQRLLEVKSNIFKGQNEEQFLIRLLVREERDQALLLIMQDLFENHPIGRALNFDPASEEFLRIRIRTYLDQGITMGCFTRESNTLVSVDCLYVRNLYDTPLTEEEGDLFRRYMTLIETVVFDRSKSNCLISFGVFTAAEYSGIGIPSDMIRMRTIVARTLRIEVFGSYFIGVEMQKAAKKNKYKDLRTFNGPKDLAEYGIDFDLPENIFPIKIMAKTKLVKVEGTKSK